MTEPRPVLSGESFVGEGAEAAHINLVLAARHTPADPFFTLA